MGTRMIILALMFALLIGGDTSRAQGKEEQKSKRTATTTGTKQGWLGVSIRDVTPRVARENDLKVKTGALVNDVIEGSPADKAGIKDDDVIIEFNGKTVEDADALLDAVRALAPETPATVVVMRGEDRKSFQVTMGEGPRRNFATTWRLPHVPPVPKMPRFHLFTSQAVFGLTLSDLNRQLGEYFEAPNGQGVLVQEVEKKSAAEKAGFKAGDVIVKVGKQSVESTGDIMEALEDVKEGEKVEFGILRKGAQKTLAVEADDLPRLRMHYFHSDNADGDDEGTSEIHKQEFKKQMEKLKNDLRSLGGRLRNQMHHLRETLRRELRHVTS